VGLRLESGKAAWAEEVAKTLMDIAVRAAAPTPKTEGYLDIDENPLVANGEQEQRKRCRELERMLGSG
jgi:hypothetical protein